MEEKFLIDVTAIIEFDKKIKDIHNVNLMMAPVYLRDLIMAQDVINNMLMKVIKLDIMAKAKLEKTEAIAYLERAGEYLSAKDIKDTAESRKKYVAIDVDVMTATEEKAKTEALVVFLKGKLSIYRQSHDDIKKVVWGQDNRTPFEGM